MMKTATLPTLALISCFALALDTPSALAGHKYASFPEVRDLILTVAARDRLSAELQAQFAAGRLSPNEYSEFQRFLSGLNGRISSECGALLAQYPGLNIDQLPCPNVLWPNLNSLDTTNERTVSESVATLDAELAAGLSDFDENLLKEQEKISTRPKRAGSATAGTGTQWSDGNESGTSAETQDGARSASESSGSDDEDAAVKASDETTRDPDTKSGGNGSHKQAQTTPADIPDGSDDDVVARQIREAAEAETDPELRAKLWEEYRRYKQSN